MKRAAIRALLVAAGAAPSGDNTQPWRFRVEFEAGTIALVLDPTRDPSPMNAGQRMARIAVGGALENLLQAARALGWRAELCAHPRPPTLAVVRLLGREGDDARAVLAIPARATNRHPYDGRPVPYEVLARLGRGTPDREGVRTLWITDGGRLAALARLIGRADALMFGEPTMRRAFLAKVRFDAPPGVPVAEGLCPASLELSAADRLALRTIGRAPDSLLRLARVGRVFAARARGLVAGASGLCLVASSCDPSPADDLAVGRAMQRAWLAMTADGLAAQPMMSPLVLLNALEHGEAALVASLGGDRVEALRDDLRTLVPELAGARPAFLLRFGYAPPPSVRTGRRPLHEICTGLGSHRDPRDLAATRSRDGA